MITIYTDKIKHAGEQRGPFILIRPEFKGDKGLLEHERTHVAQWAQTTVLSGAVPALIAYLTLGAEWIGLAVVSIAVHGLLYKFLPEYRLDAEVEAMQAQVATYPDDRTEHFARMLASSYGLDISYASALLALRKG